MFKMTLEQLKAVWPTIPTGMDETIQEKLDDALVVINASAPNLTARMESGQIDKKTVQTVVRRVVARAVKAEQDGSAGITGHQFTTGPFSQNLQFVKTNNGDVYLTKDDKKILRGGAEQRKAFNIPVGRAAR